MGMMMYDNGDVKAGREFHTNKDIGVKAQMEGVKWLWGSSHPLLLILENDKQAYRRQLKNEGPAWYQLYFFS